MYWVRQVNFDDVETSLLFEILDLPDIEPVPFLPTIIVTQR